MQTKNELEKWEIENKCPDCKRDTETMSTGKTWFDMEEKKVGVVHFCNWCDTEYVIIYDVTVTNPRQSK